MRFIRPSQLHCVCPACTGLLRDALVRNKQAGTRAGNHQRHTQQALPSVHTGVCFIVRVQNTKFSRLHHITAALQAPEPDNCCQCYPARVWRPDWGVASLRRVLCGWPALVACPSTASLCNNHPARACIHDLLALISKYSSYVQNAWKSWMLNQASEFSPGTCCYNISRHTIRQHPTSSTNLHAAGALLHHLAHAQACVAIL